MPRGRKRKNESCQSDKISKIKITTTSRISRKAPENVIHSRRATRTQVSPIARLGAGPASGRHAQMSRSRISQTPKALSNKTAVITGSTSGIGLGVAKCLASKGCNVIIHGFGDPAEIRDIQDELKAHGVKADYVGGDLTKVPDVQKMCAEIDSMCPDGIDILVNNAGFQHVCPIEEFPVEKWDSMIAVMLTTPFLLARHFVNKLRKKGWGRIINIASVHGLVASPNKAAYVSAKHGIVGLTKVVALETAGSGVTCNAICPAFVHTPMFEEQIKARAAKEGCSYKDAKALIMEQVHPTKEPVGLDQVAEFVAFVCSPAADQMTGSALTIDAGWTAR